MFFYHRLHHHLLRHGANEFINKIEQYSVCVSNGFVLETQISEFNLYKISMTISNLGLEFGQSGHFALLILAANHAFGVKGY
jgi:hypothetical protein